MICTLIVQDSLAARLLSVGLNCVPPTVNAGAKLTPAEPAAQVVETVVAFTVMFDSASVNVALVSATAFGLLTVMIIVLVPPTRISLETNAFCRTGAVNTSRTAELEGKPAVGPSVERTPLVTLGFDPGFDDVIATITVH